MTNRDTQQAFARVLTQLTGMNGPGGFISADVALLRADHADRMTRAEAILAENARIVAALPPRRPVSAESPARRQLREKLTVLASRIAGLNVTLQLEALRRRLDPPNTN